MQFDEDTGDVTVTDTSPVVKCAADNSFPPLPWICTSFEPVPVQLERTTSIAGGAQLIRVVDRWSSTDGGAHTLNLTLRHFSCFDYADECSAQLEYRFPARPGTPPATRTGRRPDPRTGADLQAGRERRARRRRGRHPRQSADGARFFGPTSSASSTRAHDPGDGQLTLTHSTPR